MLRAFRIIDAHLDLAWTALQWNRNLLESAYTIRATEVGVPGKGRAQNTVSLPDMRRGRVAVSFVTMLARSTGHKVEYLDYGSQAQAYGVARGQLAYYRALEMDGPGTHSCRWLKPARAYRASGKPGKQRGLIPLDDAAVRLRVQHGKRRSHSRSGAVGRLVECRLAACWVPTHYGPGRYRWRNRRRDSGLTELGAPLLREMSRLGMLLDLTHFSDEAFWEAVKIYDGLVLASHNNCRALVPHQRQFSDEQLKLIIERDGVVGAAFDIWMLQAGFRPRR